MLGVVNGVVLGHIRMPYALATKKMIPYSEQVAKNNRGFLTNYSALISLGCSLFWFLIHYLTQKFTLMSTGDISEIAIVFGYLLYMLLYIKVLMLYKQKVVTNTFTGLIAPILAMIGGLIIVIGGFSSNPKSMMIFFLICFIFSFAGYSYYKKKTI
jgi:APA family basic amino acid/polyamine antiporter